MRRILVPLDGGPFAEQALDLAASIASKDRAQLDIVAVHAPLAPMAPDEPLVQAEAIHTAMRATLVTYAGDLAERTARSYGVTAVATVVNGDPATEIKRFASAHQADLVVMCTHGRGPVARAWLGSVADRLLRTFDGQLLLLRPDTERRTAPHFRTALVALDGSALSEMAIPAARELLAPGGTLVLARCVTPVVIVPLAFEMPIIPPVATTPALHAAAERYLTSTSRRLANASVSVRTTLGESPNTAGWLVEQARAEQADLIAISTHGRTGFERLVLGSVADKVIRSADVPVLVCHPRS
ncbi:MAG TPA: universal stress protein [Gemmatimonadales bacterium]|nr:universal stress protein [Gemmatimonadales bacterium]